MTGFGMMQEKEWPTEWVCPETKDKYNHGSSIRASG